MNHLSKIKKVYEFFKQNGYKGTLQEFKNDFANYLKKAVLNDENLENISGGTSTFNRIMAGIVSLFTISNLGVSASDNSRVNPNQNNNFSNIHKEDGNFLQKIKTFAKNNPGSFKAIISSATIGTSAISASTIYGIYKTITERFPYILNNMAKFCNRNTGDMPKNTRKDFQNMIQILFKVYISIKSAEDPNHKTINTDKNLSTFDKLIGNDKYVNNLSKNLKNNKSFERIITICFGEEALNNKDIEKNYTLGTINLEDFKFVVCELSSLLDINSEEIDNLKSLQNNAKIEKQGIKEPEQKPELEEEKQQYENKPQNSKAYISKDDIHLNGNSYDSNSAHKYSYDTMNLLDKKFTNNRIFKNIDRTLWHDFFLSKTKQSPNFSFERNKKIVVFID